MRNLSAILLLIVTVGVFAPGCSKKKPANAQSLPPEQKIIGTDATNEPVSIKLKWLPGKTYRFNMQVVAETIASMPEPIGVKTNVFAINHDYVISVGRQTSDGGCELDISIPAQKFFYQPNARNWYCFDSRQKPADDKPDPFATMLRKVTEAHFHCQLDAEGQLVQVRGFSELNAQFVNDKPDNKTAVEGLFSETNARASFAALAAIQSPDAVRIGGSWPIQTTLQIPFVGGLTINAAGTPEDWVEENGRQCVRIGLQGKLSLDTNSVSSAVMKLENSNGAGEALFDPQLGTFTKSVSTAHAIVTASILGQTAQTTINATSNFRLVSIEDNWHSSQ
jgi:hypothetical protein